MSMFSLERWRQSKHGTQDFPQTVSVLWRHRARRMEHRIARAVSAGAVTAGGVAGAVAGGSTIANRTSRQGKTQATKDSGGNTSTSSMGQRARLKGGCCLDTKNKVKDKANAVKENIKDMPTQTAYAVYSAKEKAKCRTSVRLQAWHGAGTADPDSRDAMEKRERRGRNLADKRMELQKAQEARQAQRKADGSATTGATRPHERPATASTIPKPSAEKMQEVKRPLPQRPLQKRVSQSRRLLSKSVRYLRVLLNRKATQPAQTVHRQNVEKVVSQETRQNDTKDRRTKVQQSARTVPEEPACGRETT